MLSVDLTNHDLEYFSNEVLWGKDGKTNKSGWVYRYNSARLEWHCVRWLRVGPQEECPFLGQVHTFSHQICSCIITQTSLQCIISYLWVKLSLPCSTCIKVRYRHTFPSGKSIARVYALCHVWLERERVKINEGPEWTIEMFDPINCIPEHDHGSTQGLHLLLRTRALRLFHHLDRNLRHPPKIFGLYTYSSVVLFFKKKCRHVRRVEFSTEGVAAQVHFN